MKLLYNTMKEQPSNLKQKGNENMTNENIDK